MPDDPARLVQQCMEGDDAARAEFITRYDPLIRRAVTRRILRTASARANLSLAEDIAHEIYVKLFSDSCRALATLRDARRLDAWLVTVTQNFVVSYLRKHGASIDGSIESNLEPAAPPDQGPDGRAISQESLEHLKMGLAQLEDKDRIILDLYYVYNLRYADIAESLGMNINTVASRILRAKRKLRDALQEHPA